MKQKYLLDAENLVFQRDNLSVKLKILDYLKFLIIGLIVATAVWLLFYTGTLNSPKVQILKIKSEKLIDNINAINDKFDAVSMFLSRMQRRDDNFYRVVSEIDPLSKTQRIGGFGGSDKYKDLHGFSNSDLLIASAQKSDMLISQLKIQSESYDTVIYFAKNKRDSLLAYPGIQPISPADYYRISDKFGYRIHPITKKRQKHMGVDFAASIGTPIHAVGNGKVISIKKSNTGYGKRVIISHGYGFKTLYAHMSKIDVKVGDVVTRGQKIGNVGNTGSSTGPHLHYEVIYKNVHKDPELFFLKDLTDAEYKNMVDIFTASK